MNNDPIVSVRGLRRAIDKGPVSLLDCRFRLTAPDWGRTAFELAHIPGAHFADLNEDLSDLGRPGNGRHPLPDPADFATRLRTWGVQPQRPVVVYDDGPGAIAARAWWLLKDCGHRQVLLLDGGFAAWQAAGGATRSGSERASSDGCDAWRSGQMPRMGTDALIAALEREAIVLVDARSQRRFDGVEEPIDRVAGHIPGARCIPFEHNLSQGRWKSLADQAAIWANVIETAGARPIVHSCGSGVTACSNVLALDRLGVESTLYWPSFSGWIEDTKRPVATAAGGP